FCSDLSRASKPNLQIFWLQIRICDLSSNSGGQRHSTKKALDSSFKYGLERARQRDALAAQFVSARP
ncbi:MAG: hypothetical protein QGG36_22870, partial [Pirellulaceae bacterium]|nr:hypothetical protein [Pirellulaceae bacterium]